MFRASLFRLISKSAFHHVSLSDFQNAVNVASDSTKITAFHDNPTVLPPSLPLSAAPPPRL